MMGQIIVMVLALCVVLHLWYSSRTWDQVVASLIGTVAWLILAISVIVEVRT